MVAQKNAKTGAARHKMTAALHIEWKKFYRGEEEQSRTARLEWVTRALGYKRTLKSTSDLNEKQLGIVLDALRRANGGSLNELATRRPKPQAQSVQATTAEIVHLASQEQVWALELVTRRLGWDAAHLADFLQRRWKRRTFTFLTSAQANDALAILLNIAAGQDLRAARTDPKQPVTRDDIRAYMTTFKRKIGLDAVLARKDNK